VIIAIVPHPDHAHLTAEGPRVTGCKPERPMTLRRCSCGAWTCPAFDGVLVAGVHHPAPQAYDVALVLHAPGDPRLGMLRAMEVAFPGTDLDGARVSAWADGSSALIDGMGGTLTDWDAPAMPVGVSEQTPAGQSFALAHLLLSLGKAVEVVTLETAT
jgi:hypothetical protein